MWPGEGDRLSRLRAALDIARREPPLVVRADLLDDLGAVVADVPSGATLVIFHSAVLTYVPPEHRDGFATQVAKLGAVWIANEGPGCWPGCGDCFHSGSWPSTAATFYRVATATQWRGPTPTEAGFLAWRSHAPT